MPLNSRRRTPTTQEEKLKLLKKKQQPLRLGRLDAETSHRLRHRHRPRQDDSPQLSPPYNHLQVHASTSKAKTILAHRFKSPYHKPSSSPYANGPSRNGVALLFDSKEEEKRYIKEEVFEDRDEHDLVWYHDHNYESPRRCRERISDRGIRDDRTDNNERDQVFYNDHNYSKTRRYRERITDHRDHGDRADRNKPTQVRCHERKNTITRRYPDHGDRDDETDSNVPDKARYHERKNTSTRRYRERFTDHGDRDDRTDSNERDQVRYHGHKSTSPRRYRARISDQGIHNDRTHSNERDQVCYNDNNYSKTRRYRERITGQRDHDDETDSNVPDKVRYHEHKNTSTRRYRERFTTHRDGDDRADCNQNEEEEGSEKDHAHEDTTYDNSESIDQRTRSVDLVEEGSFVVKILPPTELGISIDDQEETDAIEVRIANKEPVKHYDPPTARSGLSHHEDRYAEVLEPNSTIDTHSLVGIPPEVQLHKSSPAASVSTVASSLVFAVNRSFGASIL